jgi:hypothetical protein
MPETKPRPTESTQHNAALPSSSPHAPHLPHHLNPQLGIRETALHRRESHSVRESFACVRARGALDV